MIYIFVGPSCSGKTSFIRNTWKNGRVFKDLLPVTETDNAYIIGDYVSNDGRISGLDKTATANIPKILPQVRALYNRGKDIVLDGERIYSHNFFDEIIKDGQEVKLYWIRCSTKTSIERNKKNGCKVGEAILKRHATASQNLYMKYYMQMNGEIIDTDEIKDFSKFSMMNIPVKEKKNKRCAIFILSHGRAETIKTVDALIKHGWTGDTWVVIDNEDDQEDLYRDKFGEKVIQFDKRDYVPITDMGDLDEGRKVGVFARNFIQDKAKEMGYDFHLQLDDDISGWNYRCVEDNSLKAKKCGRLDDVIAAMVEFMDLTRITSLSFGHPAYYPGGSLKLFGKGLIPKTMTTFMMRADDVQYFHMRMNDDITTSALNGMRGKLYYTFLQIMITTELTQIGEGGMTEAYRDSGTYRKSFYSVMAMPSCAKISCIGEVEDRIHHQISWRHCTPKLLSERWKK